jgi:hypothetical protein
MPLDAAKLKRDLKAISSKIESAAKQIQSQNEAMKKQLDAGQLTQQQYDKRTADAAKQFSDSVHKDLLGAQARVIADYLNGMQDMSGDGPLVPFTQNRVRPLLEEMFKLRDGITAASVARVEARAAAHWATFFPLNFGLTKPPPGSIRKLTSIGAPSVLSLRSVYISGSGIITKGSFDDYVDRLASAFEMAAKGIIITITHLIPATPSPVPGPPIVGPAK